MTAPLLGVRVPERLGRQTDGYAAPGPGGRQLAVVLQAFDDVTAQTCLAGICALYLKAGVRLIGVEAADGPVRPTPGRTDVADLIRTEMVSAGVLSLINAGAPGVQAWGVDDVSVIPHSHRAMEQVSAARADRDALFEGLIRPLLRKAQEKHYQPELAGLRQARLEVHGGRKTVLEQARFAEAAARRVGLDLAGYQLVLRFLEFAEKEKHLSPKRAAKQQQEFLTRVMSRVKGWYRSGRGNRVDIDLAKAAPVLEFWLRETGQSVDDFYTAIKGPNPEPVFAGCKRWYDAWLLEDAGLPRYFEKLIRLALYLEVPYFDLRDFREYVAQSRDSEALRVGLDDELSDLSSALIEAAGAGALGDLEDRLDLIYRMCQLAVGPKDAEARVSAVGTIEDAIQDLLALLMGGQGRPERPPPPPGLTGAEAALEAAKEFLRCSRMRSEHMVKRTMELMTQRNEDRAVLAVGGFHARAIARALDDYPQVSWAILMPQVDVDAAWRQHRQRF
jgi:hypothetical protein